MTPRELTDLELETVAGGKQPAPTIINNDNRRYTTNRNTQVNSRVTQNNIRASNSNIRVAR